MRLEAAKTSLQAAGIVGSDRNVSVNVGLGLELKAGYVIDLGGRNPGAQQTRTETAAGAVIVPKPAGE